MTIKLYNCTSEPNSIPKDLILQATLQGSARDVLDVINPRIRVEVADGAINCNYAFIEEFGRYYYIREITQVCTGIVELEMAVDVLQTYYPQFKDCAMIAQRSDSHYNVYAADPDRQFYQYKSNQYIKLGTIGFPNILIIVTAG